MKKSYSIILLIACFINFSLVGEDDFLFHRSPAVGGLTVAGTTLARADIALAKSLILPNAFKGSLGESVAGTAFLKGYLNKTGNWQCITPRSGPHGLDHVFIKTDSRGNIIDLIVGESKYNTSRLGMTSDGRQMGIGWIGKRLAGLGSKYTTVANKKTFLFEKMPLNPNRNISVILKNGKERFFWSDSSKGKWRFSGTRAELEEARKLASNYGKYLIAAGNDVISYRSRIFNIIPEGNDLIIDVYDAGNVDKTKGGGIRNLKKLWTRRIAGALDTKNSLLENAKKDIAISLQRQLQCSDKEASALAEDIQRRYNAKALMSRSTIADELKDISRNSLYSSLVAIGIDALCQLAFSNEFDWEMLALTGGSTLAGVTAGQLIHRFLLSSPMASNFIKNISGPLNCSSNLISSAASSFSAGVISTAIFSYGLYFLGYADLKTANRSMIVGTAATGAAILASTGTMAAVAAFGTAGTGTAIASLSGAAATQASLAVIGGGTVAAGGGGVALGAGILTAGAAVVAMIVAYGGWEIYRIVDAMNEKKRISLMIVKLSDPDVMNTIIYNDTHVSLE